jgi:hypothetical protein
MSYIHLLPQELQEEILNEVPQYTQLSRQTSAGGRYLQNVICHKPITTQEFLNYINNVKPVKFFIYIDGLNEFIVIEGRHQFGRYHIVIHHLDYESLTMTMVEHGLLTNYINLKNVNIYYDIVTTTNIYNLRNQCHHLHTYLVNQLDRQLSRPGEDELSLILNNIKLSYYIVTNIIMLGDDYMLAAFTIPLRNAIYNLQFDQGEYMGDEDDLDNFDDYMNLIYSTNIEKINDYINTV